VPIGRNVAEAEAPIKAQGIAHGWKSIESHIPVSKLPGIGDYRLGERLPEALPAECRADV
jgi:hypothetical protein